MLFMHKAYGDSKGILLCLLAYATLNSYTKAGRTISIPVGLQIVASLVVIPGEISVTAKSLFNRKSLHHWNLKLTVWEKSGILTFFPSLSDVCDSSWRHSLDTWIATAFSVSTFVLISVILLVIILRLIAEKLYKIVVRNLVFFYHGWV